MLQMKAKIAIFTVAAVLMALYSLQAKPKTRQNEFSLPDKPVLPTYTEIWEGFYGPGNFSKMLKAECVAVTDDGLGHVSATNESTSFATIRLSIDDDRYAAWKATAKALLATNGFDRAEVHLEEPSAALIAGAAYGFSSSDIAGISGLEKQAKSRNDDLCITLVALDGAGEALGRWQTRLDSFRRRGNDLFNLPFRGLNRLKDVPVELWDWKSRGFGASENSEDAEAEIALHGYQEIKGDVVGFKCEITDIKAATGGEDGLSIVGQLFRDMVALPCQDFAICRYETTQALWEHVMGNNPSCNPAPDNPVEKVSAKDIEVFLAKLNAMPDVAERDVSFRLPSETEWTVACLAGGTNEFGLVEEDRPGDPDEMGWNKGNSEGASHGVGTKRPNIWGLYDMHGNVREWTSTRKGFFQTACGGGWCDPAAACRAQQRHRSIPERNDIDMGFRLAASITEKNREKAGFSSPPVTPTQAPHPLDQ